MLDSVSLCRVTVLQRTARLLPHDNNTGGFFLALFEKLDDVPGHLDRLLDSQPTHLAPTDLIPPADSGQSGVWTAHDTSRVVTLPLIVFRFIFVCAHLRIGCSFVRLLICQGAGWPTK